MTGSVLLTTDRGEQLGVETRPRASGTMKDVHFCSNGQDVVAVFREKPDAALRDRIAALIDTHRPRILDGPGGEELAALYRWPRDTLSWHGRLGIVVPAFRPDFFFATGSVNGDMLGIRGREKEGKWFASAHHRQAFLAPGERGVWADYLKVCTAIARAVRRLHAAGLAHSDLSYRNVLVDPLSGSACVIDIDGLVVPGKYPPDVVGTPDFIAPEVVASQHLDRGDPGRILPSIATDRHALAVLVYMYLLGRHPLQGRKVHDPEDAARDDMLAMGARALWVEHPEDPSNRVDPGSLRETSLPWGDPAKVPHRIWGPHLAELFRRAFVEGLHAPARRPTAEEWERALVLTGDLLLPCAGRDCAMGGFVYDNALHPRCPLCGTPYPWPVPVLTLYSTRGDGRFRPDGQRVVLHEGAALHRWHENRFVFPSERLSPGDRAPRARPVREGGAWHLVNDGLEGLKAGGAAVPPGARVRLEEGTQLLLSSEDGGRLALVQMANG